MPEPMQIHRKERDILEYIKRYHDQGLVAPKKDMFEELRKDYGHSETSLRTCLRGLRGYNLISHVSRAKDLNGTGMKFKSDRPYLGLVFAEDYLSGTYELKYSGAG